MYRLLMDDRALHLLDADMQDLARDLSSRGRLRSAFERMRDEVFIPSINQNFAESGRPKRWEPISEETFVRRKTTSKVRKRATAGYIAAGLSGTLTPLQDTGAMRRAAVKKARFTIRENTMTYGNWPDYRWFGMVHDIEEIATRAEIPHRPFVMIQSEDIAPCQEILGDWVEAQVNKNIKLRYP